MSEGCITREDLQIFRIQLLDDLKRLLEQRDDNVDSADWVKSAEARRKLKVSPGTLQNMRANGSLHPVKIQGEWRYNMKELDSLFEKGE